MIYLLTHDCNRMQGLALFTNEVREALTLMLFLTICDPSPHSNIFTAPFFFRAVNEWLLDISQSDLVDAMKPRVNQTAGEKVVVTTFSFFKAELSKPLSPMLDVGWSYF